MFPKTSNLHVHNQIFPLCNNILLTKWKAVLSNSSVAMSNYFWLWPFIIIWIKIALTPTKTAWTVKAHEQDNYHEKFLPTNPIPKSVPTNTIQFDPTLKLSYVRQLLSLIFILYMKNFLINKPVLKLFPTNAIGREHFSTNQKCHPHPQMLITFRRFNIVESKHFDVI